jgi:hypothetical protein
MNTFKSAFYSLSAATLLTSSAFAAEFTIEIDPTRSEVYGTNEAILKTTGGESYWFRISLENQNPYVTATQFDFNLTTENNEVYRHLELDKCSATTDNKENYLDTAIFKNFVIYKGSIDPSNRIGTAPFNVQSVSKSNGVQTLTASLKNSEMTFEPGKNLQFTNNENAEPTAYIIAVEYDQITQEVEDGNFHVTLHDVKISETHEEADAYSITFPSDDVDGATGSYNPSNKIAEYTRIHKKLDADSVAPSLFHEYVDLDSGNPIDNYDGIIEQEEKLTITEFYSLPIADYINRDTGDVISGTRVSVAGGDPSIAEAAEYLDLLHGEVRHYNNSEYTNAADTDLTGLEVDGVASAVATARTNVDGSAINTLDFTSRVENSADYNQAISTNYSNLFKPFETFSSHEFNDDYANHNKDGIFTTAKKDVVGSDMKVIIRLDEKLQNNFCNVGKLTDGYTNVLLGNDNLQYLSNDLNTTYSSEEHTNNISLLNEAFTFTDSDGNKLVNGITNFSCYTTCLSQKRLDPGEDTDLEDLVVTGTELQLTVDPTIADEEANTCDSRNTIAVGDVTVSYTQGLLKDDFNNEVASFSGLAYKDSRPPVITGVEVDVDTKKKGRIVFDEPINMNGTFSDIVRAGDANKTEDHLTNTTYGDDAVTLNFDSLNDQSIEFEASEILSKDKLFVRFVDGSIADKVGNESNITQEGEFGSANLEVYIVPDRWNLISIPSCKVTTSKNISKSGTVQTIWGYDNDTWTKSPKKLEAGKGYWVKTLPVNQDRYTNTTADIVDYNTSGTLYEDTNETLTKDYSTFENDVVEGFYNVQTTGYDATYVNSSTILGTNSDTTWKLLGIDTAISWADAHSQVPESCQTLSIFQYSPLGQGCDDGNCGAWNAAPYIPSYSGLWVKQENCD